MARRHSSSTDISTWEPTRWRAWSWQLSRIFTPTRFDELGSGRRRVLLGAKKLLAKLLEKLTGVNAGAEGGDYQSPKRGGGLQGLCRRQIEQLPTALAITQPITQEATMKFQSDARSKTGTKEVALWIRLQRLGARHFQRARGLLVLLPIGL